MSKEPDPAQYTPTNAIVGVVGVGDMGSGIARSIMRAGFPLVVLDRRAEAVEKLVADGASSADDLAMLARACDVVFLVVVSDEQVKEVAGALLEAGGRIKTIVVCSTVLPETVIQLGEQATLSGVALVDAPVSGGAEKSSLSALTIIIGGAQADVERCQVLFEAMGSHIFHVGPIGPAVPASWSTTSSASAATCSSSRRWSWPVRTASPRTRRPSSSRSAPVTRRAFAPGDVWTVSVERTPWRGLRPCTR